MHVVVLYTNEYGIYFLFSSERDAFLFICAENEIRKKKKRRQTNERQKSKYAEEKRKEMLEKGIHTHTREEEQKQVV